MIFMLTTGILITTDQVRWEPCKPSGSKPVARLLHTTTLGSDNTNLYLIGGHDGSKCLKTIFKLDTSMLFFSSFMPWNSIAIWYFVVVVCLFVCLFVCCAYFDAKNDLINC